MQDSFTTSISKTCCVYVGLTNVQVFVPPGGASVQIWLLCKTWVISLILCRLSLKRDTVIH